MGRGGRGGNRNRGGHRKPFGGGGKGKNRNSGRDTRTDSWNEVPRSNDFFEGYYRSGGFLPEDEFDEMWATLAKDLPNSFRFTGTKSDALAVREIFKQRYIPKITSIKFDGELVDPPRAVKAFPDELVWDMTTHKKVIRKHPPFAEFQKFLVAETTSGNVSRQEVVSMIPPHFLDVRPGMVVLDMCAAPGSKSAQLAEMIHGDEEERVKKAASGAPFDSEGGDYNDDGRSTGLLIANDTDYKRAGMLVHQVKRLNFPNLIVTQHDASIFPSIEIPSTAEGKRQYLKFDRILADVPCSGDGTARKNVNVWQKWTPKDGLGLHNLQLRILFRGLQMLKKGGRLVYSTCSMNPVENEAVIQAAIDQCGGTSKVTLVDCSDHLPDLIRKPGLTKWKIFDISAVAGEKKIAHNFSTWESFDKAKKKYDEEEPGRTFSSKISKDMFPILDAPEAVRIPLERCMRVYPHLQDTGGFFIAVLEKMDDIRIAQLGASGSTTATITSEKIKSSTPMDVDGTEDNKMNLDPVESARQNRSPKRKLEGAEEENATKRVRVEAGDSTNSPVDAGSEDAKPAVKDEEEDSKPTVNGTAEDADAKPPANGSVETVPDAKAPNGAFANETIKKLEPSAQGQKEYFEYLPADDPTIASIFDFFGISDRFPRDRFLVRNKEGLLLNKIYYTSELCKTVIKMNKERGMRFVHCGVIMFVAHKIREKEQLKCNWRLQDEGIKIVAPWASKRIVQCTKNETLHTLLKQFFPKLPREEPHALGEVGDQLRDLEPGCAFMNVNKNEEEGFPYDMVFPIWRHPGSINLMTDKDDRKAFLLRLYNESNPEMVNHVADKAAAKLKAEEAATEQADGDEDDENGGVKLDGLEE
ncbi:S-adenosyl-L-methionine-dependent methyltransferase [Lophiotrema nucula]|uniref:S-adenosyl-L-methionine-dependent methyltransferase n=1 Tax=Lophiotrema nucula TaxID=690887 RepID=A0A6A5YV72_9PLEO|nr:S-adenosyl-L-methionine-dependent methyltransferase [Lophiotrema nucula]